VSSSAPVNLITLATTLYEVKLKAKAFAKEAPSVSISTVTEPFILNKPLPCEETTNPFLIPPVCSVPSCALP
jgi:hypothetical protein